MDPRSGRRAPRRPALRRPSPLSGRTPLLALTPVGPRNRAGLISDAGEGSRGLCARRGFGVGGRTPHPNPPATGERERKFPRTVQAYAIVPAARRLIDSVERCGEKETAAPVRSC